MSSSMLYTVGMALDRAHAAGLEVELLVEGQWLKGLVAAYDGTGVVLELAGLEHSVVKMERVAAVKILTASPMRAPLTEVGAGRSTPMPAGPYSAA